MEHYKTNPRKRLLFTLLASQKCLYKAKKTIYSCPCLGQKHHNLNLTKHVYTKKANRNGLLSLVAEARLERTTSRLWAWRATNCSTPRYRFWKPSITLMLTLFSKASAKVHIFCELCKYFSNYFLQKVKKAYYAAYFQAIIWLYGIKFLLLHRIEWCAININLQAPIPFYYMSV